MSECTQTERGVSERAVEIVSALAILLLGSVVVFDSVRLGWRWGSDGPQAGYFPFYIGCIICFCAVMLLLRVFSTRTLESRVFVSWGALRRVMQVLGPAAIYVLGIQLIGIYIASAAYIATFMIWLGGYRKIVSAAIGCGVMAAFFVLFEMWFKVPLYKGLYDPLAFLGY